MSIVNTINTNEEVLAKLQATIITAIEYENATGGNRHFDITGEVGEVLICFHLGLRLVADKLMPGFDAIDNEGLRVQIKVRHDDVNGKSIKSVRLSSFSEHEFDYALLGVLNHDYTIREIWKAEYKKLQSIIGREKRRNPSLSKFQRVAQKIY